MAYFLRAGSAFFDTLRVDNRVSFMGKSRVFGIMDGSGLVLAVGV